MKYWGHPFLRPSMPIAINDLSLVLVFTYFLMLSRNFFECRWLDMQKWQCLSRFPLFDLILSGLIIRTKFLIYVSLPKKRKDLLQKFNNILYCIIQHVICIHTFVYFFELFPIWNHSYFGSELKNLHLL